MKQQWSYTHSIGFIHIENWNNGKPFLIVTEDKYYNKEHHGYNYYKLGVTLNTAEEACVMCDSINNRYSFPKSFDSKSSQSVLLKLQDEFKEAEIAK